ncbi:hypothetical protein HNY73_005677 [Argiope bruennichi]|uniref:Ig-like domain-containing protein n=1 Tax=Argiope bruennichi TaxID=94029 RepID=A0A8T0FI60_ARGBR|nr:hypothetical protein HNY73_005677 [Argiope bruennichi]
MLVRCCQRWWPNKARVAPLGKSSTIPRLELCAAVSAVKIYAAYPVGLRMKMSNIYYWRIVDDNDGEAGFEALRTRLSCDPDYGFDSRGKGAAGLTMLHWIVFVSLLRGVTSLRLVSLEVPDKVARGQGTRLTCGYDLEGDTLYSIKWYRDDVEFFRYVPTDRPPGQFFPLQGIKVDLGRSANGSVYIRDISHLTAGIYKCEV